MRSAFDAEATSGWPGWRDMRPLLLRSAGVVGLAATIVAAVSNDALFVNTDAASESAPAVWQEPSTREEPVAAVIDSAELRESGEPIIYASEPEVADRAPTEDASQPVGLLQPDPFLFTAEPVVNRLERTVFKAPDAQPAPPPATSPTPMAVTPDPEADAPMQTASLGTAIVEPAPPPTDMAALAEPAAVDPRVVAAERLANAVEAAAAADPTLAEQAELTAGAVALWAQESVDCPRDWIASDGSTPARCDTVLAMLTEGPEPDDQAALQEAAAEHAMQLQSLGPRVPRARPEPAPEVVKAVTKVATAVPRRRAASDWPSAPPPDCGSLHAYWRFTDRKTGAKEWYCK